MKEVHANFVLVWSGLEANQKSMHGIGFLTDDETVKNFLEIEYVLERIAKIK